MYQRIEDVIPLLEKKGFEINDPWDVVDAFEQLIAEYAGSRYAVTVDNCTDALFLCLKYLKASGEVTIPSRTYLSVPGTIIHAGCNIRFDDINWKGIYQLKPLPIIDGAGRFTEGMYVPNMYQCLSFHFKKILNIGKGGMILTNDRKAYEWFKVARYEGRHINVLYDNDEFDMIGWNMYMPPEQAARGILLFDQLPRVNADYFYKYPDLSRHEIFQSS